MSFKEILMVNAKCCINFTLSHIIPQKLFQINLNHFSPNLCSDNIEEQENNIIYFQSTKGKRKSSVKGYVYQQDKTVGQTAYWKCEKREECNGRLILTDGYVKKEKRHNHAPDTSAAKIQRSMSAMKESVKNGRECTSSIINRHMEEIQKEFRPYFPTEVSMKRTLQRHRRKG